MSNGWPGVVSFDHWLVKSRGKEARPSRDKKSRINLQEHRG
jgi:hypothetical protein